MTEDPKLQGLCKECTHRKSCEDAKRYLNMTGCSRYKHWRKRNKDDKLPIKVFTENPIIDRRKRVIATVGENQFPLT